VRSPGEQGAVSRRLPAALQQGGRLNSHRRGPPKGSYERVIWLAVPAGPIDAALTGGLDAAAACRHGPAQRLPVLVKRRGCNIYASNANARKLDPQEA